MSEKIYYVTKYALSSRGVFSAEGKPYGVFGLIDVRGVYNLLKLGRDCFESELEARAGAEVMRVKKIASLRKQIEKLEQMAFN